MDKQNRTKKSKAREVVYSNRGYRINVYKDREMQKNRKKIIEGRRKRDSQTNRTKRIDRREEKKKSLLYLIGWCLCDERYTFKLSEAKVYFETIITSSLNFPIFE